MEHRPLPAIKEKRMRGDEENDDGDNGVIGVDHVDRFSHMPEHIVHRIMATLPTKDAARTSVLSKHFLFIWRSFPVLNFDYRFFSVDTSSTNQINFMDSIIASIGQRLSNDGSSTASKNIESLRFRFPISKLFNGSNDNSNSFLNVLLSYAVKNSVKQLIIDCSIDYDKFFRPRKQTPPHFPIDVLSANSIKLMNLCGLSLVGDEDHLITVNCPLLEDLTFKWCTTSSKATRMVISCPKLKILEIKECKNLYIIQVVEDQLESFSFELNGFERSRSPCEIDLRSCKYSLKALNLKNIVVSDEWFREQISELVSLQAFKLAHCQTLHTVIFRSSKNLERVELINCEKIEYIDVVSQSLEYFHYYSYEESNGTPLTLSLYHSECLKDVRLEGANIKDEWILDHFNPSGGFQILENFCLKKCRSLEKVEINCSPNGKKHLKYVEIIGCNNISSVEINAPNLEWFNYDGPLSSTVVVPSINLDAQISIHGGNGVDFFHHMRNFLSYFGHCKTLTLVCSHEEDLNFSNEAREGLFSPLYDLKYLKIKLLKSTKLANIVQLINYLLWLAPSLDTISIDTNEENSPAFLLKLHHTNELEDEEEDDDAKGLTCCVNYLVRCWRHNLTGIEVADNFEGYEERARLLQSYFMANVDVSITTSSPPTIDLGYWRTSSLKEDRNKDCIVGPFIGLGWDDFLANDHDD